MTKDQDLLQQLDRVAYDELSILEVQDKAKLINFTNDFGFTDEKVNELVGEYLFN